MPQKVSTSTMSSEGFSPEDWLPVIEPFQNPDNYYPSTENDIYPLRPDQISLEDYLKHEDNQTGANPSFSYGKNFIFFWLEYSPYLRSNHDIMLRGTFAVNYEYKNRDLDRTDLSGFSETVTELVEKHKTEYLYPPITSEEHLDIANIEIPDPYKKPVLDETVQACDDIIAGLIEQITTDPDYDTSSRNRSEKQDRSKR